MSVITLALAKKYLNVIHSADDDTLQQLLDAAEDEALQFLDRDDFSGLINCDWASSESSSSEVAALPASVVMAVLLLLQANYQAAPQDQQHLRDVAEIKLMPYRCNLGV